MTYEEMLEQINNIPMFGVAGGLHNLKQYLAALDHPERDLRVIHVAGTNGKGSVSAFTESVLREAGYKTALFTSPHLQRINERFRINFQECADEPLIDAWMQVREVLDHREERGLKMLTYFEIMFLMGMLIFKWEKPDYCIVETGLGGRLDATVLTNPVLSMITSISLDHTALLGDTIPQIAGEKAGIIKEGVPVVCLDENNGAFEIISKEAETKKSQVLTVSYGDVTFLRNEGNTIDFSFNSSYYKLDYVNISTSAPYQMVNAAMAMVAVHHLLPDLPDETMRRGIRKMIWPGRMEEIEDRIYVDGAHNPGAIARICQMMQGRENWKLLFAVCADKDYESMVKMLADINWKHIYITKIKTARGAGVDQVETLFRQYSQSPITINQISEEAVEDAKDHLASDEYLLCLGSLYLVGELKEHFNESHRK